MSLRSLLQRRPDKKGIDWNLTLEAGEENATVWFLKQKGFSAHRFLALIIGSFTLTMAVIILACAAFGTMEIRTVRSTINSFMMILAFLLYPLGRKSWKEPLNALFIIDVILVLLTIIIQFHMYANIDRYTWQIGEVTPLEKAFGVITFFLVLEAARRTSGLAFALLCLFFLIEPLFSLYLPGILYGPAVDFEQMVDQQFMRDDGVFGLALGVMVSTLAVFLIFGAFLQRTSTGQFFIALALSAAGRFKGGAAKVAVIASALMGMITGSVTANVATVGSVTIPLMKRVGYQTEFAAGVEACGSTGGQIMPPVMGVAAFLVAAIVGIPYSQVCKHAIFPAILFYAALFFAVHMRALKTNLKAMDKVEVPSFINVVRDGGYLGIPILIIVFLLIWGYSPEISVVLSLVAIFALSFVRAKTRFTPLSFLDTLEEGGKIMIPIGVACSAIGLIIGSVGSSGLAMRFMEFVVRASSGNLTIGLLYATIAGIILGMGVPTAVVYIFLAVLVVPALIGMGVPVIAAHMFAFYWGVIGNITPPVCMASFAAAAVARASLFKVGLAACRIGLPLFVLPFSFVYAPDLLWTGSIWWALRFFVTVCIGMLACACATEGYLVRPATIIERILLFVSAACLMKPGGLSDLVGLGLLALIILWQYKTSSRFSPAMASHGVPR
jgi:TRAP transporter 4TM/12TM fusion protein